MNREMERELWEKAQKRAREKYDEELGWISSWDEADKYEREDRVHAEYERLVEEYKKMAQMRDSKGRFISNKGNNETTNKNLNERGHDTMERKMNNAEKRMETLKANGIATDNFFDLSMRIPMGAEVKILVNGKEVTVPTTNHVVKETIYGTQVISDLSRFNVPTIMSSNGDICNAETGEVLVMANDPIAQSIIDDGYVKNSKLFRRWITAKTFSMLNYQSYRNPSRKGWEACMKDCYSYGYVFKMLKDELHTLAKLQHEDPEYFRERTMFFNGDVVVATLEDYLYRLKKYVKKQLRENPRKYRGEAYCKLARYGNVLVKDLDDKVYNPIQRQIDVVKIYVNQGNYAKIEKEFNTFMTLYYNKLPYETTKCAVFKDAYKGAGAFYSLQNMIRFHNVVLKGYTNKYDSEARLYELLNGGYKKDVWKFHQLLVDTIEYNNFDLRKSIAEGNCAPGTHSDKAERYYR